MSKSFVILCQLLIGLFLTIIPAQSQSLSERLILPNGWGLSPAGGSLPLGDLPLNIAISEEAGLIAVSNSGQSEHSIHLIDASTFQRLDTLIVGKTWIGLKFDRTGKSLFASGGHDNWILKFDISKKKIIPADTFVIGKPWIQDKISVAGIEYDNDKKILYSVTSEDNSLYVINIENENKDRYKLDGEAYTCLLSPDGSLLYVSCWGCDKVQIFNTNSRQFIGSIAVGDNPNDMCLSKDGKFLYVSVSNDNTVAVINTDRRMVIEYLNAALFPDSPSGSTTNGVALSPDENTLYIANADNNCLAVFEVSKPGQSKSLGFIPTGWYPTCVRTIKDKILVANGKGFSSFPNPKGPDPSKKYDKGSKVQYIGGLFRGTLSIINNPDTQELSVYSQDVYKNTPYNKSTELETQGEPGNPIPMKVGDYSPIKYVFYIIKENRTYDQVLSDIPGGNGDTSLLLFGERITPNQHKLAKEFVLLDNFYVNGEVSADGHNWTMGAYATDFLEKNWPLSYGGRGGHYNAEGTREVANNKAGFLWDMCKKFGVTYRTYGEFADDYKANIPSLEGHFCPYYTGWDESVRDTVRFGQWKRDFDSLIAINKLPRLNTLRFINDHTEGLSKDKPTPFAHVADNDLAVGLFVEHLSNSPVWGESVVFIVEDDAQNGPDHVDAHRTTAYLAGPFVKRKYVDHTMYSTASMLRTIELILGLPPMTQYDAAATSMWRCFSEKSDLSKFIALPSNIDLAEKNMANNIWQQKSEEFDFSKEDRAPDEGFNEVIWKAVKGLESECPPPVRSAFVKYIEE